MGWALDVTGECRVVVLQMGPSGSGKTTLLDVLAGRKTAGKTRGSILFAGVAPTSMFLRRYTGYVEQFGESPRRMRCTGICVWHALTMPSIPCACSRRLTSGAMQEVCRGKQAPSPACLPSGPCCAPRTHGDQEVAQHTPNGD